VGSSKPAVLPISLKLQATGDLSPVAGQRIGFKVLVVQPSMLEWYAWDDVPSAAGSGATPTGAGWFVMVWRWRTSQQLPPLSHRGKFLWEWDRAAVHSGPWPRRPRARRSSADTRGGEGLPLCWLD